MRWWLVLLLALVCAAPVWADNPRAISLYNPAAVPITTSSTAVLSANTDRRFLQLINDSDTVIYCTLNSSAAVVGKGERLSASGGNLFMDVTVPTGAINCIHNGTGSKSLIPVEG